MIDAKNHTIRLDTVPERDGRTEGQKWSSYYSGLHCEQCGRAGKTSQVISR